MIARRRLSAFVASCGSAVVPNIATNTASSPIGTARPSRTSVTPRCRSTTAKPAAIVVARIRSARMVAPSGKHVRSVVAQFAPPRLKAGSGTWNDRRDAIGQTVVETIAEYAPNLKGLVTARQVLTPGDLETTFGLTGGHVFHGEHALDQLFTMRPLLDWAQYRTPVKGLYLCGSGTHPGGGVSGAPGFNASREVAKDLRGRSS